jgi:hypothetical protein
MCMNLSPFQYILHKSHLWYILIVKESDIGPFGEPVPNRLVLGKKEKTGSGHPELGLG